MEILIADKCDVGRFQDSFRLGTQGQDYTHVTEPVNMFNLLVEILQENRIPIDVGVAELPAFIQTSGLS